MSKKHPRTRQEDLESKEHLGEEGGPVGGGRAGGELARKKGTKDEIKRANERPAGATRVRKRDEANTQRQRS